MQIAVQETDVTPVDGIGFRGDEERAVGILGIVTANQGFDRLVDKLTGFGINQDADGVTRSEYELQVGLQDAQVLMDQDGEG